MFIFRTVTRGTRGPARQGFPELRRWGVCFALAFPVAAAVWLRVPFWFALVSVCVGVLAVIGQGKARRCGQVALMPVLLIAAAFAVHHATAAQVAPGPAVVTWQPGMYSSYGTPSFSVGAMNNGASAGVVHTITVEFVNERTAQVITSVTEHAGVTVPAGQGRTLTYSAPQAIAGPDGPAVNDRDISITVTSWS
jgi:hypothetical protein